MFCMRGLRAGRLNAEVEAPFGAPQIHAELKEMGKRKAQMRK